MRELLIVATLLLFPVSSLARDRPCSANPMVSGKPFMIHGRLSFYTGNPALRLWHIGTRRLLGVSDGRFKKDGYANIPESISTKVDFETDLYGDFEVYPFTDAVSGVMQLICIESGRHLVVKQAGA